MIYFTSDTHYNHKNIVRGTSSWIKFEKGSSHQNTRNFKTLEEHNSILIKNINKIIKEDDTLYHLGDWSFGGITSIWKFRKQLNCKNIHLILGNHDHHIENDKEVPNFNQEDYNKYNYNYLLQTKASMHDLFSSVQHYKEIKINGHRIILCHYAMKVWNKSHHGSIMLYGHSHGTLEEKDNSKTMDVGVDTNNLKPYSWSEIQSIMSKRNTIIVDHHNKNTN